MRYFDGLEFHEFNEIQECCAWIDRKFSLYALNFVYSGSIRFREVGSEWKTIEGPAAFWTHPDVHYQYGAQPDSHWHHFYATFSGPRVSALIRGELFPHRQQRPSFRTISDPGAFRRGFQGLLEALSTRGTQREVAIHRLEGLLLSLSMDRGTAGLPDELRRRIMEYAEEIESSPGTVEAFPRSKKRIPCSEAHFRRVFRKLTGLSPGAFRNRARLDLASHLLRTTDRPLKAIAQECGFCDAYHFSKLFKRANKRAPGEYRKAFQLHLEVMAPRQPERRSYPP